MQKQGRKLLANVIGMYVMSIVLLPSTEVTGIIPIIIFGVVLWFINLLLRPLLLLIVLPINMLTLGIFSLLVNTWMIMIVDMMVKGVRIPGFRLSLMVAVFIVVIDNGLKALFKIKGYHVSKPL